MRAHILNRAGEIPADHWYQIEVTGEHPAGKKRKQVIDQIAMESIVNRFNAEKAAAGENFAGMLTDNDHLSHDLTKSTEALAWAQELEIRDGQLHARLDLTDIGEPAIRNKRFKFFSTEYDPEDLEDLGDGRVRPLRLAGLAFTNRPNNRGQKPISNRSGDEPGDPTQDTKPTMQPIATKLGLPADADEAAILNKLTAIMAELESLKGKTAETDATAIMNRFGKRIPEAAQPEWKKRLITNREDTEKLMETTFPETAAREAKAVIFNRAAATSPETITNGGDDATRDAERNSLVNGIRNRDHSTFQAAWVAAKQEKPELFV